jgi:exopolyphosphatase/guanosine-5'-triphosphate,3'-diphosphate pyrophosphatase
MTERAAVIDVGSNTLHLLVADCDADSVQAVHDLRVRTGLGVSVAAAGAFGETAIHQTAATVHRFVTQAHEQGADRVLLLATHAVRVAADRAEVVAALEEAAGVALTLLSPEGEAALCLSGAALDPLPGPPFLLADIGGGSTDLALVTAEGVTVARSLPIGSGVLAARYFTAEPPAPEDVDAAAGSVDALLAGVDLDHQTKVAEIVVTGGSARRLRRQYGAAAHVTHAASAARLQSVIDRLLKEPMSAWPHPLKSQERVQITRAGAVILRAVLRRWYIDSWRVSSFGLREGALRELAAGRPFDRLPAPVTTS